jgi:hypothetical protein
MTKKPDMLSAFTRAARSAAPAPAVVSAADPLPAPSDEPAAPARRSPRPAPAATRRREDGARKNLVYRTSRANWLRIRQLALADDISVQDLFHQALCHEFESRGLRPLDG